MSQSSVFMDALMLSSADLLHLAAALQSAVMRVAAALLLLVAAARAAAVPSPVVVAPLRLQLSQAPWAVAALDLPPGADVALSLRPAVGAGAPGAAAPGTPDAGGKASLSLALSASPPPGLYTLRAVSTSAAWQQAANVTLVGRAPLVVRAAAPSSAASRTRPLTRASLRRRRPWCWTRRCTSPAKRCRFARCRSARTSCRSLARRCDPHFLLPSSLARGPYALRLAARATRRRGCATR